MKRYSICPKCGQITAWPVNTSACVRRCIKCNAKAFHPMADDIGTAECLAKYSGGKHENNKNKNP